jgi:hypothetical protein
MAHLFSDRLPPTRPLLSLARRLRHVTLAATRDANPFVVLRKGALMTGIGPSRNPRPAAGAAAFWGSAVAGGRRPAFDLNFARAATMATTASNRPVKFLVRLSAGRKPIGANDMIEAKANL